MSISFVSFTPSSPHHSLYNPFTPKILLAILLTVCHTVLVMLGQRIWYWINKYPLTDIFFFIFITAILKSLVVPVIRLALIGATYSRIAPFFALNRIIFPANEEATLKTKQPIRFQGLFKVTNVIAGK